MSDWLCYLINEETDDLIATFTVKAEDDVIAMKLVCENFRFAEGYTVLVGDIVK